MIALIAFLPMLSQPSGHALSIAKQGEGFRVAHATAFNSIKDLTIEAWIKPKPDDSRGPFHFIVSKNYGGTGFALLLIGRGDDYRVQFEANDIVSYPVSMQVLKQGWWHVAGVFRGGKSIELFMNGVKVAEHPTTLQITPNQLPLGVGTSQWDSFVGQVDDIRIWNVARTQAQIVANSSRRLAGNEQGLIASWDFERYAKGRILDRTRNALNGEIVGQAKLVRK